MSWVIFVLKSYFFINVSRDARVVNGLDLNYLFSYLMASASQVRILFTTLRYTFCEA
jgi:hypothetical protein